MASYLLLNTNNPSDELYNILNNSKIKVILETGSQLNYDFNQVTS